ncbi:MAG TPA: PKD domain-containing protein, partial [Bacteroidia bacterium]
MTKNAAGKYFGIALACWFFTLRTHAQSLFSGCDTVQKNYYCFSFSEENTINDKDTAALVYQWDFGDGTKALGLNIDHCFNEPGKYLVQLNVIDNTTGLLFTSQASYELTVEEVDHLHIDGPDTVKLGYTFTCSGEGSTVKDHSIKDYTWGLDGHEYGKGKQSNFNFTEEGTRTIYLSVSALNNTTKQLENFCVKKFVTILNDEKLYSKNNNLPLNGNDISNGNSSAFIFYKSKVLKAFIIKGVYRYTLSDVNQLVKGIPYYSPNIENPADTSNYGHDLTLVKQIQDGLVSGKTSVEGYSVFFGVARHTLNSEQRHGLDSISTLLHNDPLLKVDVIAYTDGTGNPQFNQKLSQQRAYSIKSYLVSKGIPDSRVKTIAYGETLVNNNEQNENT